MDTHTRYHVVPRPSGRWRRALATVAIVVAAPTVAAAATEQALIMSPVDGTITSSPQESPPHHLADSGSDWSADLATGGAGRPVHARFEHALGNLELRVSEVRPSSCRIGGGGQHVVVQVTIGGVHVGQIRYLHLANAVGVGPIANGQRIGDVATGLARDARCWTGPHVHIEARNIRSYSCWRSAPLGAGVNGGTAVGVIGGEWASGRHAVCPDAALATRPAPPQPPQPPPPPAQPAYSWAYVSQAIYATHAPGRPVASVPQGTHAVLVLLTRNTGTATWRHGDANPVRLGASAPRDRSSRLYLPGHWITPGRAGRPVEPVVAPGGVATFMVPINTNLPVGVYREDFGLLAEGREWLNDLGQHWMISITPPLPPTTPTTPDTTTPPTTAPVATTPQTATDPAVDSTTPPRVAQPPAAIPAPRLSARVVRSRGKVRLVLVARGAPRLAGRAVRVERRMGPRRTVAVAAGRLGRKGALSRTVVLNPRGSAGARAIRGVRTLRLRVRVLPTRSQPGRAGAFRNVPVRLR